MFLLTRIVHVMSLGLWFGTTWFFTFVVGLSVFNTFEQVALLPADQRPMWLPAAPEYEKERPSERFPEPLRKEQGTRVAGAAVGPMFPWYFAIQAFCGGLALMTALSWAKLSSRVARIHKIRTIVLLAAVTTVAVGWYLEQKTDELTKERNALSEIVLKSSSPTEKELQDANTARATFGQYHGYSMMVNLTMVILVTAAMAMAGVLPESNGAPSKK